MSRDRYFTPRQVERLIPRLAPLMAGVMAAFKAATTARERLAAEKDRITLSGGGLIDRRAWRQDSEAAERQMARAEKGLEEIVKMGGVPKDLELGLVDFPHLRGGRTVNLCWKYGETEIRHWHGLREGYARRKPL